MRPRDHLLKGVGSLFALVLAFSLLALPQQTRAADKPEKYGVIIALGVGHEVEGKPSFRMVQRVGTAVQAYREKKAKYILFCGGYTSGHIAEAEEMKIMALTMGVPARKILLENGSLSTVQNASNAEEIIEAKKFRSALLVTHKSHMARALSSFEKIERLRRVGSLYADEYEVESVRVDFEMELPPLEGFDAVFIHGKSRSLDFRGETIVEDKNHVELAYTAAYLYQNGLSKLPFYVWHRAYGVGHIARSEALGIACIAMGVSARRLIYSTARRFAPDKLDLFEEAHARGWTTVLAVIPRSREKEAEKTRANM